MTKYLVLWRRKAEEFPNDPEVLKKVIDIMMSSVARGMKEGTLLDWGISIDGIRGYSIVQNDGLELQKDLMLLDQYMEVSDVLEVKNFEESQKSIQAVLKTIEAMQK